MKDLSKTEIFRLITLKHALCLEMLDLKRKGQSAYSIVKKEFGFKGSRKKVYNQLESLIREFLKKERSENHGNN